jgi:hypothetical protein
MATNTLPLEMTPEFREKPTAKNVAVGVVILITLIVAGLFALRSCTAHAAGVTEFGVVYIEGLPEIKRGTELSCLATPVGKVHEVTPGILGLQLTIVNPRWVDHRETMTITPGSFCEIGTDVKVKLNNDYTAAITTEGATIELERVRKGTWIASIHHSAKIRELLVLTSKQFRARILKEEGSVLLYAGDVLRVGGLEVQWADLARFTKIGFEINVNGLRDVTDTSLTRDMVLAPGTTVGLSGGIGITKPAFKIQPVLASNGESHRLRYAATKEYSPMQSVSIENLVATLGNYLTSPNKMHAPPTNRFEKIVADANLTMEALAESAPKVNALIHRIDNQLVPDAKSILADVKSLTRGVDSTGLLEKLLRPDQRDSLQNIVRNVSQLARDISSKDAAILRRLLEEKEYRNLDSALTSLKHFSATIDSLPFLDVLLRSPQTRKDVIEKVDGFPSGWMLKAGLGAIVGFELLQAIGHIK